MIKPIHNARFHLPPVYGVPASTYMAYVYPLPVIIGGYFVMQWTVGISHANIGVNGEKLKHRKDLQQVEGR